MISGMLLHHVGIVLPSEEDVETLMAVLGMREDYRGFVPQWSALCIFARADKGSRTDGTQPFAFLITLQQIMAIRLLYQPGRLQHRSGWL